MKSDRLPPLLMVGGAFALFAAGLADAANRFAALPGAIHTALTAAGALLLVLALVRRDLLTPGSWRIVAILAGAALVAFSCRLPLYGTITAGPESASRAADRVDAFLADLTREVGDAAYLVARTAPVAAALEGSDAGGTESRAFRALSEWPLPGTAIGDGGATLYDRQLRPVAWSGGNPDLEEALSAVFPAGIREGRCPDPAFPLFVYSEGGRRDYLAAAECTRNLLGLVTVEVPIREASPPPRAPRRSRRSSSRPAGGSRHSFWTAPPIWRPWLSSSSAAAIVSSTAPAMGSATTSPCGHTTVSCSALVLLTPCSAPDGAIAMSPAPSSLVSCPIRTVARPSSM